MISILSLVSHASHSLHDFYFAAFRHVQNAYCKVLDKLSVIGNPMQLGKVLFIEWYYMASKIILTPQNTNAARKSSRFWLVSVERLHMNTMTRKTEK